MSALLVLLLTVHLLAINVASGGPLLYALLPRPSGSHDATARLTRDLGWTILIAFLVGSLAGLLLGMVIVHQGPSALANNLPAYRSKIVMGVAQWFFFLAVWGAIQALAYRRPTARWAIISLGLIAATNLLYHFPPLFTLLATYAHPPDLPMTAARFRALAATPPVLAMWIHVILACLAIAALALAWLATRPALAAADPPPGCATSARRAIWMALAATALQLPAGVGVLISQDRLAQVQLTGADLPATLALGASVVLTLLLLYQLAELLGGFSLPALHLSILTTVLIVLLMCTTLMRLRTVSWSRDIGRRSVVSQEAPPWAPSVFD